MRGPTFNPDCVRWNSAPLNWTTPSAGSLCRGHRRRKSFSFACLPSPSFGNSIPSLALEPTSSGFQGVLKTSWDTQPHGLNNYWTLGRPLADIPGWASWITACRFLTLINSMCVCSLCVSLPQFCSSREPCLVTTTVVPALLETRNYSSITTLIPTTHSLSSTFLTWQF